MQVTELLKSATGERKSELILQLKREKYRRSFFEFFKDACSQVLKPAEDWQFNWHHNYICDVLQGEAFRMRDKLPKTKDIIINCPPSVSKSSIVSVCLTAWVWGFVNPHETFINISHSDDLSIDFASQTKDLIESDWYKTLCTDINIRIDSSSKSNFRNTVGGQRISISMMAGVTGHHSNWIILDDYLDAKSVSDIKLDTAQRIYRESIFNRLANPKVNIRVLIGQRLSDKDLYNFLLTSNKDKYLHICLPMQLTDDVSPVALRNNYVNGVLWNERFPETSFSDLTDSDQVFATQYLQSPAPIGGGIIKREWLEIVEAAPLTDYHLFVDSAFTSKKTNDPTCITVCGLHNNAIYVKQVFQVWLEFPELVKKIKGIVNELGSNKTMVFIEPKASGKSIAQQLKIETMLNVIELPQGNDSKAVRLNAITPKLESRRVKFVRGGWNDNAIYELTTFPNARHDDFCDTLIMAVNKLLGAGAKFSYYM
ncbi:hypothetical protein WSM22_03460 [Cytophagales bacterium WSM2-2]|nr:hypothetical protein WSM22_03460 [Cytophagales bacterium WSM2-2]